jgi:hypothetical protein
LLVTDAVPYDAQLEWITDQEHLNPRWAEEEFKLREQARAILERLETTGEAVEVILHAPIKIGRIGEDPPPVSGTYNTVRFRLMRIGGNEELLLIEECLRRAYAGVGW